MPYSGGTREIALLIGASGVLSAGALPLVEAMTLGSPSGPARYGPIRLWGSVGFIAIVLAGGLWLDFRSAETLPAALALLALAALGASVSLPRGATHPAAQQPRLSTPPGAGAVLGAGFGMALAHGALSAFFTLHLQREGHSGIAVGVLAGGGRRAGGSVFCVPSQASRPVSVP